MGTGRKRKLHFSKIYTFNCLRGDFKEEHSQIGSQGFSRVVFCNEPNSLEGGLKSYADNYVSTTKYTPASFLPKSLYEQFKTKECYQLSMHGPKVLRTF